MAASIQILKDSGREVVVKLVNDGTTETGVTKVDASTLTGAILTDTFHELQIVDIVFSVSHDSVVSLAWGASTPVVIAELSGTGSIGYHGSEMFLLKNNAGTGRTGDITLTTRNWGATKAYTIILKMYKNVGFNRGGDPVISV